MRKFVLNCWKKNASYKEFYLHNQQLIIIHVYNEKFCIQLLKKNASYKSFYLHRYIFVGCMRAKDFWARKVRVVWAKDFPSQRNLSQRLPSQKSLSQILPSQISPVLHMPQHLLINQILLRLWCNRSRVG